MFVAVFALPLLIATGLCILTQGKHITNLPTPKDYEVQDLKKYGVEGKLMFTFK